MLDSHATVIFMLQYLPFSFYHKGAICQDKESPVRAALSELLAVLGAKLICTGGAFQRGIGSVPESLRVHYDAQLPNKPGQDSHSHKGDRVGTAHKDQRREHHQMIPVEDPAGGTAAGLHQQPERAPNISTQKRIFCKLFGLHLPGICCMTL